MNKYKVTIKSGELTQEHMRSAQSIRALLYVFDDIFESDWHNEWEIVKIELIEDEANDKQGGRL